MPDFKNFTPIVWMKAGESTPCLFEIWRRSFGLSERAVVLCSHTIPDLVITNDFEYHVSDSETPNT